MRTRHFTYRLLVASAAGVALIAAAGAGAFAQRDDESPARPEERGECAHQQDGPPALGRDYGAASRDYRGDRRYDDRRYDDRRYDDRPGPPPPPHMRGQEDFRDSGPRGFDGPGYGPLPRGEYGPRGFDGPGYGPPPPPRMNFEELDANGDGAISRDEFEAIERPGPPRDFGPRGEGFRNGGNRPSDRPDRPDRPPRFEDHDTNGDGKLSPEEAEEIPPVHEQGFSTFDDDGDGFLTRDELPPPPGMGGRGPEARGPEGRGPGGRGPEGPRPRH